MTWHFSHSFELLLAVAFLSVPALLELGALLLAWRLLVRRARSRDRARAVVAILALALLAADLVLYDLYGKKRPQYRTFTCDRTPGAADPRKFVELAFLWDETPVFRRESRRSVQIRTIAEIGTDTATFYRGLDDEDPLLERLWKFHARRDRDGETAREIARDVEVEKLLSK